MSKYIGKLTSKETNIKSIITIITRLLNSKPHSEQDSISNKNHPFYPIRNNIKPSTDVTPQVSIPHTPIYPHTVLSLSHNTKIPIQNDEERRRKYYLGMISSWKKIGSERHGPSID